MGFQGTCEGDLGLLNQAAIWIRSVAQSEAEAILVATHCNRNLSAIIRESFPQGSHVRVQLRTQCVFLERRCEAAGKWLLEFGAGGEFVFASG